jgi:hypothetical protein
MKNLILVLALLLLPTAGFAESGKTGSLNWSLDNGTLTISGTGAMPDYEMKYSESGFSFPTYPWSGITAVNIGDGVTSIGNYAFMYQGVKSVTIPGSVTSIGAQAFFQCSLTSVIIPNSVKVIECGAFAMNRLTSVIIPNSVKVIESGAFAICLNLTDVTIGNGVTEIGWNAFYGCESLTSVNIPNSVTEIGTSAFGYCSRLNAITVDGSNTAFSSIDGVLFNKDKTILIQCPEGKTGKSYDIPSSVKEIEWCAFWNSSLTAVNIPNSVTRIGMSAFESCRNLKAVIIPNSVTEIEYEAFFDCDSLRSVTVGWATPLTISSDLFEGVPLSTATLHVPAGTKALYATADVWKDFGTILEDAGVDTETIPSAEMQVRMYGNQLSVSSPVAEPEEVYSVGGQLLYRVQTRMRGNQLSVSSPVAEPVEVYSIGGQLLYRAQKSAGVATFDLNGLPDGVLIVKGNGWTKKIVR